MAIHSSILTWRIPGIEEPGRLQSVGLQKLDTTEQLHLIKYSVGNLGHDLSNLKSLGLNAGPKAPVSKN